MFPCSAEIVLRVRLNRSHIHHGLLFFMIFFYIIGVYHTAYVRSYICFQLLSCFSNISLMNVYYVEKRKLSVYICVTHNSN